MSVQATTWVWQFSKAQDNTLLVALAVADAANAQGAESCQSVRTICRMTRASETTVHRALRWLLEAGEIEYVGTNPRYGGTRVYRFPALWPASTPPYSPALPGGADMAGGATEGTGGVPSGPERGAVGGTQPQRTPQEEHPTSSPSPEVDPGVSSAAADGVEGQGEQPERPPLDVDKAFEAWWAVYPRKVAKKDAKKAYAKALKEGATAAEVFAGLEAHLPGWHALDEAGNKTKIPHPATWLNGGRWEDRPEEPEAEGSEPEADPADWMKRRRETDG